MAQPRRYGPAVHASLSRCNLGAIASRFSGDAKRVGKFLRLVRTSPPFASYKISLLVSAECRPSHWKETKIIGKKLETFEPKLGRCTMPKRERNSF